MTVRSSHDAAPVQTLYCRSTQCRARIFKARTTSGKLMPLDAEPLTVEQACAVHYDGVYAYVADTDIVAPAGPLLSDESLFRSHWKTCRAPEEFK